MHVVDLADIERIMGMTEAERLREEIAAVRKSLGEFFCPIVDEDGNDTNDSYFMDQGVHILAREYELALAEIKRLTADERRVYHCPMCGELTWDQIHEPDYRCDVCESVVVAVKQPIHKEAGDD